MVVIISFIENTGCVISDMLEAAGDLETDTNNFSQRVLNWWVERNKDQDYD